MGRAGTLHVTNGESAASTLRQTRLGGAVLAWEDVLTEGPVPRVPAAELREVRARFLGDAGWGEAAAIRAQLERRDDTLTEALGRGHLVLWFEHDLFDQLQLLQILALAAQNSAERLELINIGEFDGRPDFHGLGELSAGELETLWPLRRPVDGDLLDAAIAAWDAVRAPDPKALEALAATESAELPFLPAALGRFLEELPDSKSGLARSERQLLEPLADGARQASELFVASQEMEEAPYDGDAWVWRRLAGLGAGDRPLVTTAAGDSVPMPPPRGDARTFAATTFAITGEGRHVRAGHADRAELLGLDRWLGGTHLRPDNDWRWDLGREDLHRCDRSHLAAAS